MNYEPLHDQSKNDETLGAGDEKLHRVLGSLKRVEAPKDFDFKLKARIANRRPQDFRAGFLTLVLRYVLPLGIAVFLAAFVAFNMSSSAEKQNVAAVEPTIRTSPISAPIASSVVSNVGVGQSPIIASTNVEIAANDTAKSDAAASKAIKIAALPKNKNAADQSKKKVVNDVNSSDGGGSLDRALSVPKEILPKGLDTTPNSDKVENFEQNKIALSEVLSAIGLSGEFVGKNWRVISVKENTPAMLSGLKIGDVIEAIDGKTLVPETNSAQTFTGKTFRILRAGKSLVIELNTK